MAAGQEEPSVRGDHGLGAGCVPRLGQKLQQEWETSALVPAGVFVVGGSEQVRRQKQRGVRIKAAK